MGPSPSSKKRAELIREISQNLSRSAARRKTSLSTHDSAASATASASENNNVDTDTGISFDPENEAVIMSTKQFESNNTNASQDDEHFQTPASELKVDSLEFEQEIILGKSPRADEISDDGSDDSISIEIGRGGGGGGGRRSANSTPSLLKQHNIYLDKGLSDDRFYNMIGYGSRKSQKRSDDTQRDKQKNNRASLPLPQKESFNKTSNYQTSSQRRTNLADMHAKVNTQDGFKIDERPPTTTLPVKSTRFGSSKLRQVSTTEDGTDKQHTTNKSAQAGPSAALTAPQKRMKPAAAQGAMPAGNTATQQSFMLPDLPDLTELVSGTRRDGTPIFPRSKSTKARSRFFTAAAAAADRPRTDQQNHIPIDRVPVPTDEKAIFASLQLLKEKVSELELYKTEADRRIEEYERDNIELRAELSTRERLSRNEPAARNADEEGGKSRLNWRTDKMRLESSVQSLQNRLDRAERKVSVSAIENKRMEKERDNLATQLGAAYYNHEDLRRENEALQLENETLRDEVDTLRFERERSQKETKYLRDEIMKMRIKFDEQTKNWIRKEAALRREKGKFNLQDDEKSDDMDSPDDVSDQAEAYRDTGKRGWKSKEAKLRNKIEQQNDTIKLLQRSTEEKANSYLREEIKKLRTQLDHHNAERQDWSQKVNFRETDLRRELNQAIIEHQEEADKWAEKEAQLKGKISKREEAVKQLQLPAIAADDGHNRARRQNLAQKTSRTASAGIGSKLTVGDCGKSSRSSKPNKAVEAFGKQNARSFSENNIFTKTSHYVDDADDASERNSTTDLEISRPNWQNHAEFSGKPKIPQSKNNNNTDVTLLSFMDTLDVAKLRKMLEEERVASRRKSKEDIEPEEPNGDNLEGLTGTFRQSALKNRKGLADDAPTKYSVARHRKGASTSAMNNNVAEKSAKTDNTQQETSHSILSNTSRRRRSAPIEMTSAFTVPDMTGHIKATTAGAAAFSSLRDQPEIHHEPKDCTICHPDAPIPDAIPVDQHPLPINTNVVDDSAASAAIDTTLRPAQPPLEALSYVLKIISDEITHLKLNLRTAESTYSALDPAIGQRRRKASHARICKLLSAIEARSEMLYKLHDVLQGVKDSAGVVGDAGSGNNRNHNHNHNYNNNNNDSNNNNNDDDDAVTAAAFAIAGKEAENTLASLGFDLAKIDALRRKTRKSVTIAEVEAEAEAETRARAHWDGGDVDDGMLGGALNGFGYGDDGDEDGDDDDDADHYDDYKNDTGNAPWEGIADDFSAPMEMVTG